MTEPQLEFRKLNDHEATHAWDRYFSSVMTTANAICHKDHERIRDGACVRCVKIVRHVLDTWTIILATRADEHAERQLELDKLVVVQLHLAYKLIAGTLSPEHAVSLDDYGPV